MALLSFIMCWPELYHVLTRLRFLFSCPFQLLLSSVSCGIEVRWCSLALCSSSDGFAQPTSAASFMGFGGKRLYYFKLLNYVMSTYDKVDKGCQINSIYIERKKGRKEGRKGRKEGRKKEIKKERKKDRYVSWSSLCLFRFNLLSWMPCISFDRDSDDRQRQRLGMGLGTTDVVPKRLWQRWLGPPPRTSDSWQTLAPKSSRNTSGRLGDAFPKRRKWSQRTLVDVFHVCFWSCRSASCDAHHVCGTLGLTRKWSNLAYLGISFAVAYLTTCSIRQFID